MKKESGNNQIHRAWKSKKERKEGKSRIASILMEIKKKIIGDNIKEKKLN